jgi:hypothetical protein
VAAVRRRVAFASTLGPPLLTEVAHRLLPSAAADLVAVTESVYVHLRLLERLPLFLPRARALRTAAALRALRALAASLDGLKDDDDYDDERREQLPSAAATGSRTRHTNGTEPAGRPSEGDDGDGIEVFSTARTTLGEEAEQHEEEQEDAAAAARCAVRLVMDTQELNPAKKGQETRGFDFWRVGAAVKLAHIVVTAAGVREATAERAKWAAFLKSLSTCSAMKTGLQHSRAELKNHAAELALELERAASMQHAA